MLCNDSTYEHFKEHIIIQPWLCENMIVQIMLDVYFFYGGFVPLFSSTLCSIGKIPPCMCMHFFYKCVKTSTFVNRWITVRTEYILVRRVILVVVCNQPIDPSDARRVTFMMI